ncbi:P68 family surface lipoprotein [Mycoplasmopsis californica]|nr:hypothetical protein [Mycoplasmopsis californica]
MKKNKKWLLSSVTLGATALPLVASSCGTVKTESKNIVFRTAQGKQWPLSLAIKPLVDYYNTTQKETKGFLPVALEFQEQHKIWGEFNLIKNVKENFETKNLDKIPNIVLGAQSGAYLINQDARLLDVSDSGITKDLFESHIANLHSKLSGQKDEKLYNLPFDNADVDSLVFNLDLMRKIFELIEAGGGTIDKNLEIYKKAQESKDKGSNIPAESIYNALKVKNDAFKNFRVDSETFGSLQSVREFSKKFAEGVEIDASKVNDKTIGGEVLSVDYQEQTFFKELYGKIAENKELFELVTTNNVNEPTKIKYNLLDDQDTLAKFKELWTEYNNSIKRLERNPANSKTKKVFQSIKYMENQYSEWGSWNILFYKSAISYAASVGADQTKQTPWAKNFFVNIIKKQTAEEFSKNAKDEDVWMLPQITKTSKNGRHYFQEGGSSILPIKLDDESKNTATKTFLKWLYTGKNNVSNPGVLEENWKTLARTSGYIIPLKTVITKENEQWIKEEIKRQEAIISNTPAVDEATKTKAISAKNLLSSSLVSLQSILKLSQSNPKVVPMSMVTDDITSKISKAIETELFNSTKHEGNSIKTDDEIVQAISVIKRQ